MKHKQFFFGLASFIPGVYPIFSKLTRRHGSISARYCYSVWLRHIVMAHQYGLSPYPKVVAELGPGHSIGIGLAALLSGAEKYYAFDIVKHAATQKNLEIFDELVYLFQNRANIPGEDEFPRLKPYLDSYTFPIEILTDGRMDHAMNDKRIRHIRKAVKYIENNESIISYKAPWFDTNIIRNKSVDMIYSQAVLEHVDDLQYTYEAMHKWLKDNGYISHQIDFKCHDSADEWNGHWSCPDFKWKLIRGKRPYFINRAPHSIHIRLLKQAGFDIVCDIKVTKASVINRNTLAPQFKNLSKTDLTTSGSFIIAKKLSS